MFAFTPLLRIYSALWYLNRFDTGAQHFHSSKCSQCSNAITPRVPEKLITFGEQSQLRSLWKKGAKERGSFGGGWGFAEVLTTAQNNTINV